MKNVTLKQIVKNGSKSKWLKGLDQWSLPMSVSEEGCDWFDIYAAVVSGELVDKLDTLHVHELDTLHKRCNAEVIRVKFDKEGEMYFGRATEFAMVHLAGKGCRLVINL